MDYPKTSTWLHNIESCLGKVAGTLTDPECNPTLAFHHVTEVCCETLNATRAGIWVPNQDQSELVSCDLYDSPSHAHLEDFRLRCDSIRMLISDLRANPRAVTQETGPDLPLPEKDGGPLLQRARCGILAASNIPFSQICFFTVSRDTPDLRWHENEIALTRAIANYLPILFHAQARARAELALKKNISLLTGTLESTDEGIVATDLNRRIILANHRFLEMIGKPAADASSIVGTTLRENFLHVAYNPQSVIDEADLLYLNPEMHGTHRVPLIGGRVLERYTRPQRIEGKIVGRIFNYRDVTARVRNEEERARLQKDLFQAQKMEAIGTLASGIAHDFNNILNGITCNLELARGDLTPQHPALESIEEITHATRRATSLVRQILTFSRQETPERTPLAIGDIVHEALGFMRSALPRTITLELEQRTPLPLLFANATQLHQVLINVCTNAWHAIGNIPGTIRVAVEATSTNSAQLLTSASLPAGKYIKLSVTDTGCGMSETTLAHIFEPFFTTKSPGHGSGLGLSVVHGIVHGYGGAINVTSIPSGGACFEIFLPACDSTCPQTATNG